MRHSSKERYRRLPTTHPADLDIVRYWDLAGTEKTEFNDPDWTVGIKLGRDKNGGYWLLEWCAGAPTR